MITVEKIKVMMVDDIEDIREYFGSILEKEPDMELVAKAGSGAESIALAKELKPHVILMDILMESPTAGLEAAEQILEDNPDIKIIILTIQEDDNLLFQAYCVGVMDYILKTDSVSYITDSIRNVYQNQFLLRPHVAQKIVGELTRLKEQQKSLLYVFNIMSSLTNSEFEILCLFFNGSNSRDIAKSRFVSSTTIKSQINSILHKFKMRNMKEVVHLLKKMKFDDFMNEQSL